MAYTDDDVDEHGIPRTGCENQFVRVYGFFEIRNGRISPLGGDSIVCFPLHKEKDGTDAPPNGLMRPDALLEIPNHHQIRLVTRQA